VPEKKRDELRENALDREKRFFVGLQQRKRDWISLGTTKTGMVYQLRRNPPHAHAYSDEVGHRFRAKAATHSNRSRPGIPMIPATCGPLLSCQH